MKRTCATGRRSAGVVVLVMLVLAVAACRMPPFNTGLSLDVAGVDEGRDASGGTLDVVFANDAGQGNAVFLNAEDGAGALIDTGQTLGSADTGDVALGDVDNDGDSDAAFANATGNANAVYVNDGAGTFSFKDSAFSTNDSFAIGLADTDADGYLDFVFGDDDITNNYLFLALNDASGGFAGGSPYWDAGGGVTRVHSLAIADFDNDGRPDVYAGTVSNPDVAYLGDSTDFATSPWTAANITDTTSVAAGDLNGDGFVDVFVGRQPSANRAYLNGSSGDFSSNSWTSAAVADTRGVALADLDGDTHLDAFVANNNEPNRVYLGDGTGSFSLGWESTMVNLSQDVALGDLDGDGDIDAVVANDSFVQFNVAYMNNGDATFTAQEIPGTEGLGSDGVAVGELD